MPSPKISIVTISYNQGSFLKECLSSVASQNFKDYEHIVVDDGSTDGSREIILNFKNKVIPVFKENSGPADSLNAGFKIARGEIFGYINSDDYFLQNTLQICFFKTVGMTLHNDGSVWRCCYDISVNFCTFRTIVEK